MKTIYETPIGGDGAKVGAYVDETALMLQVNYPLAKIVEPVNTVIDNAINKLEALIPGDWDKALLEPIRTAAKAEILALLAK